jgi:hypothetical protein
MQQRRSLVLFTDSLSTFIDEGTVATVVKEACLSSCVESKKRVHSSTIFLKLYLCLPLASFLFLQECPVFRDLPDDEPTTSSNGDSSNRPKLQQELQPRHPLTLIDGDCWAVADSLLLPPLPGLRGSKRSSSSSEAKEGDKNDKDEVNEDEVRAMEGVGAIDRVITFQFPPPAQEEEEKDNNSWASPPLVVEVSDNDDDQNQRDGGSGGSGGGDAVAAAAQAAAARHFPVDVFSFDGPHDALDQV